MRHFLTLLLLSGSLFCQTYDVNFNGYSAQVEDGQFAKLTDTSGDWAGDVTVHDGEVLVMNGALENYVGTLAGTLTVSVDGVEEHSASVQIHDGCGYYWHRTPLRWNVPTPTAQKFLNRYYDGGMDPELYPQEVLVYSSAGPNPDPEDPGNTGSGRVAWNRYKAGDILRIRHELGLPDIPYLWDEAVRWGLTDWDRSQNYYAASNGYKAWNRMDYPNSVLGAYRSNRTFNTTYGNTELFGRPSDDAPGNWPSDYMHCDNAKATVLYAITGSWAAKRAALAECHSVGGQMMAKGWSVKWQRTAGWTLRCWALYYGVTGDPIVVPYLENMLQLVENAQAKNPGYSFVQSQNGSTSGGYIKTDQWFIDFVSDFNLTYGTSYDAKALSEGSSAWQEAILGISLLLAEDLAPDDLQERFQLAGIKCGITVFQTYAAPGFTPQTIADFVMLSQQPPTGSGGLGGQVGGTPISPSNLKIAPPTNQWGINMFQSRTKGGRALEINGNWITGVGGGTVLPFAETLGRKYNNSAPITFPISDAMTGKMYVDKYWTGKTPDSFLWDRGREWLRRQGEWHDKSWTPGQ